MWQPAMRARKRLVSFVMALGIASIGATTALSTAHAQGSGDLLVSPTRVVFEGRDRTASLSLSNRGSATATFRISVVSMTMDDKGDLTQVENAPADLKTAENLVRYAPRQVVIAPGGTQAVRISLRKPANLPDGEYRSHMFFRAVPPEDAGQAVTSSGPEGSELQIRLIPIYGITIPLIVRQGTLDFKMGIDKSRIETVESGQAVAFTLTRSGARSSFGDIRISYRPAGGGNPLVVGQITRLAVYTPNMLRNIVVPLRVPDGVKLEKGELEISYLAPSDQGSEVLATDKLPLP